MSKQENPVSEVIPMRGWRKTLAERMINSHLQNAEVTQIREISADTLVDLRQSLVGRLEKEHGFRLSYTHLIIKAAAQALAEHPIVNSSLVEDEIRVYSDINIGLAVALESGGLLTPVIRQADKKSIVEVAREAIQAADQIDVDLVELGEGLIDHETLRDNLQSLISKRYTMPVSIPNMAPDTASHATTRVETIKNLLKVPA